MIVLKHLHRTRRVRAAVTLTVSAVAVSLLVGCSLIGGPGGRPVFPGSRPSATGPQQYDGPEAPPLRADRLWQSATKDHRARVIALRQDGIILTDAKRSAFALDLAGRQRWALPDPLRLTSKITDADLISPFGRSLDGTSNKIIAAAYKWDSCEADLNECYERDKVPTPERGIVAVSALDGKPVWTTVLEPSTWYEPGADGSPSSPMKTYLVPVVSESAVLVEVRPSDSDAPVEETTTIALDPETGEQLWSKPGLVIDWAGGDRVLGQLVRVGSGGILDYDGYPVVLDARTGHEIWRGSELGSWSITAGMGVVQDTYGYGMVTRQISDDETAPPNREAQVVELRTGTSHPVDHQGRAVGRDANGPFLSWIMSGDGRFHLLSQSLPAGPTQSGALPPEVIAPVAAAGSYLWSVGMVAAFDRTGAKRLDAVPGVLAAVDERWLVTRSESLQLNVYRLSS
jgi:outer membrane protein assembly factor BamB